MNLIQAFISCEGLRKNPVPLVYTRHTSRFLALWIFLLPLALVHDLQVTSFVKIHRD